MEQTLDDILLHYGVKGMKWGVHRKRSSSEGIDPVPVRVRGDIVRNKVKVKTSGGELHPPSEDAVRAAVSKQKAKKSGTNALSNQELQQLVQRMNLEQQYSKLSSQNASPAAKFVRDLVLNQGKQQLQSVVSDYGNQVGKALKDK